MYRIRNTQGNFICNKWNNTFGPNNLFGLKRFSEYTRFGIDRLYCNNWLHVLIDYALPIIPINPLLKSSDYRMLLVIQNIYTSSVFCYYEHKKNFDIHSSVKAFRDVWAGWRLFWIPPCCVLKNGYFIAKTGQFWWSINIRIEFYKKCTSLFLIMLWETEDPRVNFEKRFAHYEIYTWTLCLSYQWTMRNKQVEFNP